MEQLKPIENLDEMIATKNFEGLTAAMLTDAGICPTCFNKEHDNCLYGDESDKMLYENDSFECYLVGNPRAEGHTAISSKKHYKDMMEIPDDLCEEIFVFAKKAMSILKHVYSSESVYLCTMCDGPMNHFHIQLIPRYSYEKRGSKNFVKERQKYVKDEEKVKTLRLMFKDQTTK
jgi:histidine triad (HIT) family protein